MLTVLELVVDLFELGPVAQLLLRIVELGLSRVVHQLLSLDQPSLVVISLSHCDLLAVLDLLRVELDPLLVVFGQLCCQQVGHSYESLVVLVVQNKARHQSDLETAVMVGLGCLVLALLVLAH